ncbi:uncharacterized protein LOC131829021 isoform X2 [Mustela lutreola]|uniref:uncharacterized protein LOC131829021 isoform X2 n=1 Tax=Mustela lutreola TaxID=9666 RepID=UPI0027971F67|nr:uncharacterized protein LOC131829021 isoform X2 [Mustela lutreola]
MSLRGLQPERTLRVSDCLLPGQQQLQHVHHSGDGSYGEAIHGHRAGPRVSVHLQADDQDEAGLGEPLEATIITTEKRGRVPGWQEKWVWLLGQPSKMGGASRLRGRGLLGSIQSVWPLSLQCRWKCSTSRIVTAVVSLVHVHHSEPKLMINPEGTIVYIHSVKSIMSKLNIYRSHTWTSLPPRLRAEKEHIPGRVPGWQEKWAWSLGQPSEMGQVEVQHVQECDRCHLPGARASQ